MAEFRDVGISAVGLRQGNNYTTCPKCSSSRMKKNVKCLTVHVEEGNSWWNCNHCGFSGNLENYEQQQKIKEAAFYPVSNTGIYSERVLNFLSEKMIDATIAKQLKWYERKGKRNAEGVISTILCIPSFRGTNLCNVKFRNLSAQEGDLKFYQLGQAKGGEAVLVGMHDLEMNDLGVYEEIIITEGETDLATWKRVRKNVLSVPMGAPNPNSKNFDAEFKYLIDKWTTDNVLDKTESFVLCVDNDEAGKRLEKELVLRLGKKKCKVVIYPKGCKDGNEVFIKHGKEGLESILKEARFVPFEGIINPLDLVSEIENIKDNGIPSGLKIGHKKVDRMMTLKPPYVYVVTGAPGSGKSTFSRWWLTQYVKNNPSQRIGLYSPEQRPYGREVIKLMEAYSGINVDSMSGDQYQLNLHTIAQHFDFIVPQRESYKELDNITRENQNGLQAIFQYLLHLVKSKRLSGYVIDAWNKLEHDVGRYDTEHNYIGKSLDKIIEFNEANNLFSIIIAHPTKLEKKSDNNYKVPGLYNISGSANWYNKADVGVIVHRDKYEMVNDKPTINPNALTKVIVEKMKFEEIGQEGEIELHFNKRTNCFSDAPFKSGVEQTQIVTQHVDDRIEAKIYGEIPMGDFNDEDDLPF